MGRKYKTKFPMARIKKIMQVDNEIGKVALATPILISKALEMFMQNLVDEAASRTKAAGSTKIETIHLKQCISETEEFDFLQDIVAAIEGSTSATPSSTTGPSSPIKEEASDSKDLKFVPYQPVINEAEEGDGDASEEGESKKAPMPISSILNQEED